MKTKFWNTDKILSITAILLSLGTFIVFIYQTQLIREHQYTAVLPYLSLGHHGTGTQNYSLVLSNDGIGPAFITSISCKKGIHQEFIDPAKFIEQVKLPKDSLQYFYSNISPGVLVPTGANIELLGWEGTYAETGRLHRFIAGMEIIIEYESIYKEKWRITKSNPIPKRVN